MHALHIIITVQDGGIFSLRLSANNRQMVYEARIQLQGHINRLQT